MRISGNKMEFLYKISKKIRRIRYFYRCISTSWIHNFISFIKSNHLFCANICIHYIHHNTIFLSNENDDIWYEYISRLKIGTCKFFITLQIFMNFTLKNKEIIYWKWKITIFIFIPLFWYLFWYLFGAYKFF